MPSGNNVSTTALVLIAVLPAVAAALLATASGYVSDRRTERRAHSAWLRERRFEVYRDFINAMWESMATRRPGVERAAQAEAVSAMGQARTSVLLVTDEASREQIKEVSEKFVLTIPDLGEPFAAGQAVKAQRAIEEAHVLLSGLLLTTEAPLFKRKEK